jgi:Zn-dependent protease with chaperone function
MTAAIWLGCLSILLFGPAGSVLARAEWPRRAPRAAIALWQATGIAGALAAMGFGLSITVSPAHAGLMGGVARLVNQALAGHPLRSLGISGALGLSLAADVCIVLLIGLAITGMRTTMDRARHRHLLDLVSRPIDGASDVCLLDDPRVAAYCLPGFRPRIVVSAGTVKLLAQDELGAVVEHERGHAHGRHGIVMLPFASMDTLLRWMPYVRHARPQVAALLEMAADDFAVRSSHPQHLAGALIEIATSGATPTCAFSASATAVTTRVERLLSPHRTSSPTSAFALIATVIVVAMPFTALL